jgi:hypothetical protein
LYKPGVGYGFGSAAAADERLNELEKTISALQKKLAVLESQSGRSASHD